MRPFRGNSSGSSSSQSEKSLVTSFQYAFLYELLPKFISWAHCLVWEIVHEKIWQRGKELHKSEKQNSKMFSKFLASVNLLFQINWRVSLVYEVIAEEGRMHPLIRDFVVLEGWDSLFGLLPNSSCLGKTRYSKQHSSQTQSPAWCYWLLNITRASSTVNLSSGNSWSSHSISSLWLFTLKLKGQINSQHLLLIRV